jgi:hypothetical protein
MLLRNFLYTVGSLIVPYYMYYKVRMPSIVLVVLVAIFVITLASRIIFNDVNGAPKIFISPMCGPGEPGFNIVIDANGFDPNSNVDWKLIDSHSLIPVYGYYQTNSTGGFKDLAFVGAVKNGHYKLFVGEDADNNKKFDIDGVTKYVNVNLPCP